MPFAQIAGAAANTIGGTMQAIGQRQRTKAFQQAYGQNAANVAALNERNRRNLEFTQGQVDPLVQQRQEALQRLVAGMGGYDYGAMDEAARGVQGQAVNELGQALGPAASYPIGQATALRAQDALAARQAPGDALRAQMLAQMMLQPEQAAAQSAYGDTIGSLARTSGEIQRDYGLRQALADQMFAERQRQFARQLADAGREGMFLGAAGQTFSNIGQQLSGGGGGLGYA